MFEPFAQFVLPSLVAIGVAVLPALFKWWGERGLNEAQAEVALSGSLREQVAQCWKRLDALQVKLDAAEARETEWQRKAVEAEARAAAAETKATALAERVEHLEGEVARLQTVNAERENRINELEQHQ